MGENRISTGDNKMTQVSFQTSRREFDLIDEIVKRAWRYDWVRASHDQPMGLHMDIAATHANGCPLRLDDLLNADEFNFTHDISGIINCLDRDTGKLTRHFRPRFSRPLAA